MKIKQTIVLAIAAYTILFFTTPPVFAETAPAVTAAQPAVVTMDQPADAAATPTDSVKKDTKVQAVVSGQLVARVVWVKGSFTATAPGGETKRVLKTASDVYMHDTLTTSADSEAQIVFTDNSTMSFRPDTKLFINEYNYKKADKKTKSAGVGSYVMDLIAGGFRTITGAIAKESPDNYQIHTPVATIGVRGTEFSVVYAPPKTFVKRYKGEPCVSQKGEKDKTKSLCLGDKNKYASAEEGSAPQFEITEPDVFNVDVEVVPVTFSDVGGSNGSGGSSFCIQ